MDIFDKKKRSEIMSKIKGKETKLELKLRDALLEAGITEFKMHYNITGKPDFAFPEIKVALFLDSCFWHNCPKCGSKPQTNEEFWENKLKRNAQRDREVNRQLKGEGWKVIRVWEHELGNPEKPIKRILKALGK